MKKYRNSRRTIGVFALILTVGLSACSPTLEGVTAQPTLPQINNTPIITTTPTAIIPEAISVPDIGGFLAQLEAAINSRDQAAMLALTGDIMEIAYWGSESGAVTAQDALQLVGQDFLSGTEVIIFLPDVDTSTVSSEQSIETILSKGWGIDGQGQALLVIGIDDIGEPYWQGIIYGREGIIDLEAIATETPTPTAIPTSVPPSFGDVIYETDFSFGWPEFDFQNGKTSITGQGYRMEALLSLWIYSTQIEHSSFYAELDATADYCPRGKGLYGLLFHYVDDTQFRFFVVTCSGEYRLYQRTSGSSSIALIEGSLPSDIDPGVGDHTLAVHASDDTLSLYVDGFLLEEIVVGAMPLGDIGVYAETIGGPLYVYFTRLAVFESR